MEDTTITPNEAIQDIIINSIKAGERMSKYTLVWSEITPESEDDGSGFIAQTGNSTATVDLYPEGADRDEVDPLDKEAITLHDERETTTPDVWDAAIESLLTRNGLTPADVLETITPW